MNGIESVVCPSCGARMRDYREFCLRCETPLANGDKASAKAPARARALEGKTVVMCGLAVTLVAAATLVVPRIAPQVPVEPKARSGRAWGLAVERAVRPVTRRPSPPVPDPQQVARVAYQGGDYQAAFERYHEATLRNPRDAESLSNCGQMLVRLGRPAEAIAYFQRAIELNEGRWTYRFNLAHAHGVLGQWDRAVEEYRQASALFPDDYATEYNLGMALHKRGDEAAAVVRFRRAIALQGSEPAFHLSLGISNERLGRTADAIEAYGKYLELDSTGSAVPAIRARLSLLQAALQK